MRHAPNPVMWAVLAAILFTLRPQARAQGAGPDLQFVQSKAVDGFVLGITDDLGSTNTPISRGLCFSIWTVTNGLRRVAFPTQSQYAYEVELFDTNRVALPKTALGKRAGSKFLDFDATAFDQGIKLQHAFADDKATSPGILVLFRASDLFVVRQPGLYNLRIRLQILVLSKTGPSRTHAPPQLIRFAPIDYPLSLPALKVPTQ